LDKESYSMGDKSPKNKEKKKKSQKKAGAKTPQPKK
jgi:hypothetical protein